MSNRLKIKDRSGRGNGRPKISMGLVDLPEPVKAQYVDVRKYPDLPKPKEFDVMVARFSKGNAEPDKAFAMVKWDYVSEGQAFVKLFKFPNSVVNTDTLRAEAESLSQTYGLSEGVVIIGEIDATFAGRLTIRQRIAELHQERELKKNKTN